MKRNPLTVLAAALVAIIFGLWLSMYQVRQSEIAVVTKFGKVTDVKGPGPHWKLPPPIQTVHKFDQRVQNFEDKLTEGLTQDSFNLLTSVYVGWQITDPGAFFAKFGSGSIPEAEKALEGLLRSTKSAVIGKHPLSDFVSGSAEGAKFSVIEGEILAAIQSQVRANSYGLDIEFLGLKKLEVPESVTQSVFDRMTSERQRLISKFQSEGDAEAQIIRTDAERKSAEVLANADGKATEIRGQGEAEAAKSLGVFQQDPELANFIFRLNALEGSLKDRSILVFDQHTPPFDLFRGVSTNLINLK
jgi:membrane protease subunit HflC